MNHRTMYFYRAEGHTYWLEPVLTVSPSRIFLTSVAIYNQDDEYLGSWQRYNMPLDLIQSITGWAKEHRSEEIRNERKRLAKTKARLGSVFGGKVG